MGGGKQRGLFYFCLCLRRITSIANQNKQMASATVLVFFLQFSFPQEDFA